MLVVLSFFINHTSSLQADNDLKFNHITVIDGLLHNSATCIEQDSAGFIWIGTQRGLNRYDGYKIDSYLKKSDLYTSVYDNRILKIIANGNYFWVATSLGLRCFDIKKKNYIDYKDISNVGLANRPIIHNLFVDSKHRIWIGLRGRMECALITNDKKEIALKNIQIDRSSYFRPENRNSTPEVAEIANGTIFLLATGKLFELQQTTNQEFISKPINTTFTDIIKIQPDGQNLWLFFKDKAIGVRYSKGQLITFDEVAFPPCFIVGIESSKHYFWLSTNQGLLRISKTKDINRVQIHSHSVLDGFSVSSDHQSGILVDNKNNLWVTTWAAGVSYTNIGKQKFELVKYMPTKSNKYLPNEFVYSIHEDNKGHIYVGTKYGGISRYNLQTKTFDYTVDLEGELKNKAIVPCIVSDDEWIYAIFTFQGSSVYRINKINQKIEFIKSYTPNTSFSCSFDKHNQLWVGVLGVGLSCLKLENGKVIDEKLYTNQSDPVLNLSSNVVNYVFSDKEKNELLASTSNGLNRIMLNEKGEVNTIAYYLADLKNPNSLSSNYLWPIDKENDSTYWIGTMPLDIWRCGITLQDIIIPLLVWCGGRYLSSFNYKTKKFKTYYEEDGLQSYLFATGTSCKASTGMLFFGGLRGMNYFMPDTTVELQQYKVFFSRLLIDGKTLNVGDTLNGRVVLKNDLQYLDKIKLPYPCNSLSIEFSSLTYAQKKNIQYRYKLEGYDEDWIYTDGLSPYATYPKLPYKTYTFNVEVYENNQWVKASNELDIVIQPPWWQSILAYLIYAAMFIAIVYFAAKYSLNWINLKRQISLQNEREKHKEELMELKMNFFTNISHEFKTPLTLINATVSEIETKNEQPKGSRNFQILKRNNSKLLHLISELMDFQRSNASLIELKTTQIDVCKFLEEIVDEFIPLGESSDIKLNLTLPSSPVMAWVDEECLTKIVSNIISNSLRYTEKGGKVDINLATGRLETYKSRFDSKVTFTNEMQKGNQLIFSITDTGIGISSESLPDIFERFHTIVSKTSKHLGSGIGLALVKSLVELHKGGVLISSERYVGTEFVFTIPLKSDYLNENQKTTENEFDRQLYFDDYKVQIHSLEYAFSNTIDDSKPTLLIVDDNSDILMVLNEYFRADFNILTALDGIQALKIINEKYPDLVVSDVMMPNMNGLELCNKIKSKLNTCLIPVILLTARGTAEQQIEGLEEGADAYIPKPFHLGILSSTINNLLNKAKLSTQRSGFTNTEDMKIARDKVLDNEKQKFIDTLTEIVKKNIHNPDYSIDDICLEIGISRSRLYVHMKTFTNETLGSFIREYRLQKAAELLRTTKLTMSEVANEVGIESSSSFTRTFKERFGMPPTEYLKNIDHLNQ